MALKGFHAESGRVGEWESGRVGEWESGRVGEWESAGLKKGSAAQRLCVRLLISLRFPGRSNPRPPQTGRLSEGALRSGLYERWEEKSNVPCRGLGGSPTRPVRSAEKGRERQLRLRKRQGRPRLSWRGGKFQQAKRSSR